jgi:hypothetical protein
MQLQHFLEAAARSLTAAAAYSHSCCLLLHSCRSLWQLPLTLTAATQQQLYRRDVIGFTFYTRPDRWRSLTEAARAHRCRSQAAALCQLQPAHADFAGRPPLPQLQLLALTAAARSYSSSLSQ